ncbi:hypothetical protein IQ247_02090 [Plectonema cf. radiosum LEGE 06105]|uniref:Uncharacterized protein n=1 Tax=Plectonema cf. radiosum LEGE 06105 TaxID=945769 RepID=A0A8J7F0W0_9CYAN|nr:hypothetical protein [Plectonema radiosum]MBE9211518.1 hypothetical protein [Plectonema cf. radiosum LEGE 06105]
MERIFDIEIIAIEFPSLLEWQGGEPDTFVGRHRFELHQATSDQTVFHNSETFSGTMASTILDMSRTALEEEFHTFNQALKKRVEFR